MFRLLCDAFPPFLNLFYFFVVFVTLWLVIGDLSLLLISSLFLSPFGWLLGICHFFLFRRCLLLAFGYLFISSLFIATLCVLFHFIFSYIFVTLSLFVACFECVFHFAVVFYHFVCVI